MKPIDVIRAACVNANPDLWENENVTYRKIEEHGASIQTSILLSDVLLAIKGAEYNYLVSPFGEFWKIVKGGNPTYEIEYCKVIWNLRSDDLSAQSEETLQFLANLLV